MRAFVGDAWACRFHSVEPRQRKTLAYRRSYFSEPDVFVYLPAWAQQKGHSAGYGDPYRGVDKYK